MEIPKYLRQLKIHDCCADHGRDWRETLNGKFPASDHSPGCNNYNPIEFKQIYFESLQDGWIDYPDKIETSIKHMEMKPEDMESMTIKSVFITKDQFEKLEEFQGF
jgi:hypothetical protein